MNTLAQELKYAKRELTNLKTAHRRGFGLLKIYKVVYNLSQIPGIQPETIYDNIKLTVRFSSDFSAYPMAYIMGDSVYLSQGALLSSVDVERPEYKDGGFTIEYIASVIYSPQNNLTKMIVYSTAPVSSITFSGVS